MKSLFALALGTIALLLAIAAQDSTSATIILACVGLALLTVALVPGAARGEPKASWQLKPGKVDLGVFSDRPQVIWAGRDPLAQSILTFSSGGSHWVSPINYRSSMQRHNAAEPGAPSLSKQMR